MGYKSFRDVYHNLAIVFDNGYTKNILGDSVPNGITANSALVFGYIDKQCGVSYKVLGLTVLQDNTYNLVWSNDDIGLTVRGECYQNYTIYPIENSSMEQRFERTIQMTKSGYSNAQDDLLRSYTSIDPFRHQEFPDDVALTIRNNQLMKQEILWARVNSFFGKIKDGIDTYTVTLLDEPFDDYYGMHKGDIVYAFVLKDNDGSPLLLGIKE